MSLTGCTYPGVPITAEMSNFTSCVGKGWGPLLTKLVEDLRVLAPDLLVVQVKEKFGELRFYTEGHKREAEERISQAEDESRMTCERCGEPGSGCPGRECPRTYWCLTLCTACCILRHSSPEEFQKGWR